MLIPPTRIITPVTTTATLGAGTPPLAAYWPSPAALVRWLYPDMMNSEAKRTRPSNKSTSFMRSTSGEVVCHFLRKRADIDRLGDVAVETGRQSLGAVLGHRVRRERDDFPRVLRQPLQFFEHRVPITAGELDVEQDEGRRRLVGARDFRHPVAVRQADHLMSLQRQQRRQQLQTVGLVFDHDDGCHRIS